MPSPAPMSSALCGSSRLICTKYASMIRERSSDDVFFVFQTFIRKNVRLSECSRDGVPMAFYDLKCHGYEDYKALTAELVGRIWSLKRAVNY